MDILEKIFSMGDVLSSNVERMTEQETKKYKKFLESELKKIEEKPTKKKGKEIRVE